MNRPPVAVVSPVNQTLYLPNSKALLEGSDSTDDLPSDQLKYSWEVLAAPLTWPRQELKPAATLQLENLTPGNYTIRSVVCGRVTAAAVDHTVGVFFRVFSLTHCLLDFYHEIISSVKFLDFFSIFADW